MQKSVALSTIEYIATCVASCKDCVIEIRDVLYLSTDEQMIILSTVSISVLRVILN